MRDFTRFKCDAMGSLAVKRSCLFLLKPYIFGMRFNIVAARRVAKSETVVGITHAVEIAKRQGIVGVEVEDNAPVFGVAAAVDVYMSGCVGRQHGLVAPP